MSNINQEKVFWCGIGIIIGCIISNGNIIMTLIASYLISAWITRVLISYSIQTGAKGINFVMNPVHDAMLKETQLFDNPNISLDYNWYHNIVTVKKNLSATIFTSTDKIDTSLRKMFNDMLFWDVLYHANPLKIVYT